MYPMIHAKGRSPVAWELRPYERSRCAEHNEEGVLYGVVPVPPGVVMLASPTLLRKAEGRKAKAALEGGPSTMRGQGQ